MLVNNYYFIIHYIVHEVWDKIRAMISSFDIVSENDLILQVLTRISYLEIDIDSLSNYNSSDIKKL
jgi:predicted transcriptional regulator